MNNVGTSMYWKLVRYACVTLITFPLSGCDDISPGQGQVLNTETNLPIEDVEVSFECQVGVNIESVRTVRVVPVLTDKQGIFRFTWRDLHGCQFGVLNARKDGYENLSGVDIVYKSINRTHGFWLVPQGESAMRKLKNLYATTIKTKYNEHTYPFSQGQKVVYSNLYFRYILSRSIAKTERERRFVIDNYCTRLIAQYDQLSPEEKAWVATQSEWLDIEPYTQVTVNHEKEVVTTCRGLSIP